MSAPPGSGFRFVCPPTWPQPPVGWTPPHGWEPDPAWGPAPAGWQFWQPDASPETAARPPIDGFAIAALVTGLLGAWLLTAIFGIVSLLRISHGRRRGRGLVFTGWGLCVVVTIIGGVLLWTQITSEPRRGDDGTITSAGRLAPMDLQVGDCVNLPLSTMKEVTLSVDVLPCAEAHNAQVYEIVALDVATYPGEEEFLQLALDACEPKAYDFLGDDEGSDLQLFAFVAPENGWKLGEHSARCLLVTTEGDVSGDVRER